MFKNLHDLYKMLNIVLLLFVFVVNWLISSLDDAKAMCGSATGDTADGVDCCVDVYLCSSLSMRAHTPCRKSTRILMRLNPLNRFGGINRFNFISHFRSSIQSLTQYTSYLFSFLFFFFEFFFLSIWLQFDIIITIRSETYKQFYVFSFGFCPGQMAVLNARYTG